MGDVIFGSKPFWKMSPPSDLSRSSFGCDGWLSKTRISFWGKPMENLWVKTCF